MAGFLLKLKASAKPPAQDPPGLRDRPQQGAKGDDGSIGASSARGGDSSSSSSNAKGNDSSSSSTSAKVDDSSSSSSSAKPATQQCHAFLCAFEPGTDASRPVNTSAPPKRYVIVGRGFAATTNLATMWCSGKRPFEDMTLCMIGKDDPWRHYVSHDMNQEVELLSLPAYSYHPPLPPPGPTQRWLDSKRFADCNASELALIKAKFESWPGAEVYNCGVTKIKRIVADDKVVYDVHIEGGDIIRASKVDICTGTGQQTYAEGTAAGERGISMCAELWQEYLTPPNEACPQPRVCSAEMFVVGKRQVKGRGSVLITSANSPAGIQAGEHALCLDRGSGGNGPAAEVVLIASGQMSDGFLPIGRLDDLARTAAGRLPVRTRHPIVEPLYPSREAMWFGDNYRAVQIELLREDHIAAFLHDDDSPIAADGIGKQLLVTFGPANGKKPSRLVKGVPFDTLIPEAAPQSLAYGLFDQVVISTGRARGGREEPKEENGSALELVWDFKNDLKPISIRDYEFPVGLQDAAGNLRILGAAGINNPVYKGGLPPLPSLKAYEDSLPWQARVNGEGITLSAVTIAIANEFFGINDNDCLNTATRAELQKLLGAPLGDAVFNARHDRVRPFQSTSELLRVLAYRLDIDAVAADKRIPRLNDYTNLLSEVAWRRYVYPDKLTTDQFAQVRALQKRMDDNSGSLKLRYGAIVEAPQNQ